MPKNISWFRDAVPYIASHQGKTFVILLSQFNQTNDKRVLQDIALLSSLGIKVVLVLGVRKQIEKCLKSKNITSKIVNNLRITDTQTLACVKQCNALLKLEVEALLATSGQKVVSGNFITARPVGIIDGVDFKNTGAIRKIDVLGIKEQLENIVLLTPLGFASTGETFNLSAEDLASKIAAELPAEKLIILHKEQNLTKSNQQVVNELTTNEAKKFVANDHWRRLLNCAIYACENHTVRVHILNISKPEVLLQELFSSVGSGTMVTTEPYETICKADDNDVDKILELISPEVENQILVARSKQEISQKLGQYYLLQRDQKTIAVMSLIEYQHLTELAALVVAKQYQNSGRGKRLVKHALKTCTENNKQGLFVFSTQTSHWFLENGFVACSDLQLLPKNRLYDTKRNSKMYLNKIHEN